MRSAETTLLAVVASSLVCACAGLVACGGGDASLDDPGGGGDAGSTADGGSDAGASIDGGSGADGGACEPIPGAHYGLLAVQGAVSDRPAAQHGDLNLRLRTWQPAPPSATRGLVSISGPTDGNAPKLEGLFADGRTPALPQVYQVQGWDWSTNSATAYMTDPEVTLAGFGVTPGEIVQAPASGYDIGQGNAAMVLYAGSDTLTLKYTPEDNVVHGYTIHLAGVCIEPSLVAAYEAANAAGRSKLPVLAPKQPLGRARGSEIQAAVRDTGAWMDPRSKKDWW